MKQSLTDLAIACVVAGVVGAGYMAWDSAVIAKSTLVANVEHRIAVKTEAASRITSVRAALAEIEGDEQTIQNYFVSKSRIVSFIDEVEQQGRRLGATVGVLSVSSVDTPEYPVLSLTFAIEGTFDAVMRTVGAIEYAAYDLAIASFSMNQVSASVWHADLKIVVGSVQVHTKAGDGAAEPSTP